MKPVVRAALVALILTLATSPAVAQMTRAQKFERINHEISWYEARESKGGWLVIGGVSAAILGALTLTGSEANWVSYGLLSGTGVILIGWGASMRWEAQQYLLHLRVKRYDFAMQPLYQPEQGNALGLALTAKF